MTYRAEIDGLRAIAVLAVLVVHAAPHALPGGFAGVDVFFVISGYLITRGLLEGQKAGTLSLPRFYAARARRILPALALVLGVTLAVGWQVMTPTAYRELCQTVIAALLFSANIQIAQETGYFAADTDQMPLLHTWSLGVEEQFYLLFPLLLLWALRRGIVMPVLAGAMALSLTLALRGAWAVPDLAFYHLPFRAWELGVGALVAATGLRAARRGAVLGLGLISAALVLGRPGMPVPTAIAAVAGTALVIRHAKTGCGVARVLAWPPLVAVGLISYAAYLWHQPLFAFARIVSPIPPGPLAMAGLIGLTLGLAALTRALVEQPLRYARLPRPVWAGAGMTAVLALGWPALHGHLHDGDNANAWIHAQMIRDDHPCRFDGPVTAAGLAACRATLGRRPVTVLIGDSHAGALSGALRTRLEAQGAGLITLTLPGCLTVPGVVRMNAPEHDDCIGFADDALTLAAAVQARQVIVALRWTLYLEGTWYTNPWGVAERPTGPVHFAVAATGDDSPAALSTHVATTLTRIARDTPLTLVAPIPEAGWDVPRIAAAGGQDLLHYSQRDYDRRHARALTLLDQLASREVTVIRPSDTFCPDAICTQIRAGQLLYADDDHLSAAGAALLADQVLKNPNGVTLAALTSAR